MNLVIAGWEALNERQTGLLLEQKKEIELAEAGILNNAQSLLGNETIHSLAGLVNSQTLSVFRDQDRWKKLNRGSTSSHPTVPVNNDLFKTSASWAGIRSQLDAEGKCKPPENAPVVDAPPLVIKTDVLEKKPETPKVKKRKESALVVEEPEPPLSPMEMSPPPSVDISEKKPEKKQKVAKVVKVKPVGRTKGPLDLDKQCGVVPSLGMPPCARSLTCKSHSMSSKRAVEGRSKPYDVLLSLVQKKPAPIKDEKSGRLESEIPSADKDDANMDSDEELNELLTAVRSYEPQPLAQRPMTYVRRRNNCLRIRDLFLDALKGPMRPILPSGAAGHDQSSMHL
ncbi:hypothetical protein BG004_003047 [Podila humilis]|nr:hypothetical protein BG004_003047 [Podila humilis]